MPHYLITGVSSGLGRGLAREVVRRGHRVWGVARRAERLAELGAELGAARLRYSVCDVSRPEEVQRTQRVMENAGFEPEVVILNAAINTERSGAAFSLAEFEQVIRVNLFGALAWVEGFLPVFRARRQGQFVAISSLAAYRGDARWIAYCASKAALSRSFEAFRGRHAREGVVFTTVHLGAVDTGMGFRSRSPFRLTEAQAVNRILRAVDRRSHSVTAPAALRLVLEALRILPDPLFSRLAAGAFVDGGARADSCGAVGGVRR
jgi:3-hydroxy acid dehydrogenase/malonic semialdehyde reductase